VMVGVYKGSIGIAGVLRTGHQPATYIYHIPNSESGTKSVPPLASLTFR